MPLIHFALLGYSKHVHDSLVAKGYDLFAKTDVRFLEAAYKLLRQEFAYRPQVNCCCPHLLLSSLSLVDSCALAQQSLLAFLA